MTKKLWAALLAVVLAISALVAPAVAAGTAQFSDVSDRNTATAIETLRMMGVLDGYGDGTFRPEQQLTRAQFCKMAAYLMNGEQELGRYRTVTIFPDVKPSHWAASYINMAAKGKGIISGYPDGKFYPERTVTVGQATTILLRLLGYQDAEVGGVWPDSYMAVGEMAGLLTGVGNAGNSPLSRAQAARLFLNFLRTEKKGGGTLYELSKETELLSVDGATGILKTADGSYQMVHPVMSTSLVGAQGQVVLRGDKALTFLPSTGGATGKADAAVVIYEDRSAAGLEALAGNTNYQIYKNGLPATVNDLRRNDVATYHAATNAILVCDTRVTVFYEACEPNPDAPTKIRVLGGTELRVLPTAVDSLAEFKPGDQMNLLMTADGQVAAAQIPGSGLSTRSNAMGIVSDDGTVWMLCGTTAVELKLDKITVEESCYGRAVRISSGSKGAVNLSVQQSNLSGDLNVTARTLGSTPLADNAMVYDNGKQISLGQLTTGVVKAAQIKYARTNWKGLVDLIVVDRATDELYGRTYTDVELVDITNDQGEKIGVEEKLLIGVEYGNEETDRTKAFPARVGIRGGSFVMAKLNRAGTNFVAMNTLTRLDRVSHSSWIGRTAVMFNGRTYEVPETVLCYNTDSQEWTTIDSAFAYASSANLYVHEGVVRIIEVKR